MAFNIEEVMGSFKLKSKAMFGEEVEDGCVEFRFKTRAAVDAFCRNFTPAAKQKVHEVLTKLLDGKALEASIRQFVDDEDLCAFVHSSTGTQKGPRVKVSYVVYNPRNNPEPKEKTTKLLNCFPGEAGSGWEQAVAATVGALLDQAALQCCSEHWEQTTPWVVILTNPDGETTSWPPLDPETETPKAGGSRFPVDEFVSKAIVPLLRNNDVCRLLAELGLATLQN